MVKKINRSKGSLTSSTTPIEAGKPVAGSKAAKEVGNVGNVEATSKQARVRRPTRQMTSAEREHLFRIIHEEADKMFGANKLPESQRELVESATRMTIDASIDIDDTDTDDDNS